MTVVVGDGEEVAVMVALGDVEGGALERVGEACAVEGEAWGVTGAGAAAGCDGAGVAEGAAGVTAAGGAGADGLGAAAGALTVRTGAG